MIDTHDEIARLVALAQARPEEHEVRKRLAWLIDLLVARGQLEARDRKMIERIRDVDHTVRLALVDDKRSVPSPDIDCAARIPLCKARCCSFSISLSLEDVREGKLEWELERPYVLRRDPSTGYCTNFTSSGCRVYADRPATCRSYDCRDDRRVWLDFENRIPAP